MGETTLMQLYEAHQGKVSDKWDIYLAEYDRLFTPFRNSPIRLLEIGIQNGGSLEIWASYFPAARSIVGCDINPDCRQLRYADPRISVVVADANTDEAQAAILRQGDDLDIVIDDGSHTSSDIVKTFARYFRHVKPGGFFLAEDLHCSYWADFEGGLFDPASSVAFFKRLADVINHEHWGVPAQRADVLASFARAYGVVFDEDLLAQVHSVEFINSLCVVRKADPSRNVMGVRHIVGGEAAVVPKLSELPPYVPDESGNRWSQVALLPEDELPRMRAKWDRALQAERLSLESARVRVALLDAEVNRVTAVVRAMERTLSWRITRPLRGVRTKMAWARRFGEMLAVRLGSRDAVAATARKVVSVAQTRGIGGVLEALSRAGQRQASGAGSAQPGDYAQWVATYDTMDDTLRQGLRSKVSAMPRHPVISVVMPTYNARVEWLREAIESVRSQIYPHWELCIADDASSDARARSLLARYAKDDPRIKVEFRQENGHISSASNTALAMATGEWIALMDHDDVLAEHALFWMADAIVRFPDARLFYSDEDKLDSSNQRCEPYFKTDWNQDLFYSQNFFCHLGVYDAALVRQVGGFRLGFEGAQDHDLVLRCVEKLEPAQIRHVPRILYHWRTHPQSTAQASEAKPYAIDAGQRAIGEHLARKGVDAIVMADPGGYRVSYALPAVRPLVSLIIPTRNAMGLVQQCIDSIVEKTLYQEYEIILVDNGSDDPAAVDYFRSLGARPNVRVLRDDGEFNYSALNNRAVQEARGQLIGLINNDIEVIAPEWLGEMVRLALQPGVGAVGAKLLYPDGRLQHAGVVLGLGGVAGHSMKYFSNDHPGYANRARLIQSYSAVTAACLIVQKTHYQAVGGLNEQDLKVAFNDVDFCLRLRDIGLRNVWTPHALLYHHESATRGFDIAPEKQRRFASEVQYMRTRWAAELLHDPAYNPNLTLAAEDFSLGFPPRVDALNSLVY